MEDFCIGMSHTLITNTGHMADTVFRCRRTDTIGHAQRRIVDSRKGTEDSRSRSRCNFQSAAHFTAIANHTGNGPRHIPDSKANLFICSP